MKLINCYIENFGILENFEYSFLEGMNYIEKSHGWGKSTFAIFIKVMLFGFEYFSKEEENFIRKFLAPRDGGNFGGYLVFEIFDKTYKAERYLGKNKKQDTFNLYEISNSKKSQKLDNDIIRSAINIIEFKPLLINRTLNYPSEKEIIIRAFSRGGIDEVVTGQMSDGIYELIKRFTRNIGYGNVNEMPPPFLIFDDSFSYMEYQEMYSVKEFLKQLGLKYQLIYLCCPK